MTWFCLVLKYHVAYWVHQSFSLLFSGTEAAVLGGEVPGVWSWPLTS